MLTFRPVWLLLICIPTVFADEPAKSEKIVEPITLSEKSLQIHQEDKELTRLLKERHNAALRVLQAKYWEMQHGFDRPTEELIKESRRVLKSKLELCSNHEQRLAVLERHAELIRFFEIYHEAESRNGLASGVAVESSKYWRLDAEIKLLRAKQPAAAQQIQK